MLAGYFTLHNVVIMLIGFYTRQRKFCHRGVHLNLSIWLREIIRARSNCVTENQ